MSQTYRDGADDGAVGAVLKNVQRKRSLLELWEMIVDVIDLNRDRSCRHKSVCADVSGHYLQGSEEMPFVNRSGTRLAPGFVFLLLLLL